MDDLNPKAIPFIFKEKLYNPEGKKQKKDLAFHGTNLKNITVLVDDAQRVYKSLEFALLKNILKALELSENDVAILDANNPESDLNSIQDQLEPKLMLSFGEGFKQTPGLKNEVFDSGETRILITDKLADLENSKDKKLALWEELKKLRSWLKSN